MQSINKNVPIETTELRTVKNGAVQDMRTGKFVQGAALDRDTARDMVRKRVEKKRAIVAQAAQDAVQRGDLVGKYGDAAWIAEVTQAQMQLATTPDAGKSAVMAAQWLISNAGMDEKQATADAQPTTSDVTNLVSALAQFVATVNNSSDTYTTTIDADAE